jgi:hypothetical protein
MLLDVLDLWIPASNLGLVNLNDGFVGLCGYAIILTYNESPLTAILQFGNFSDSVQITVECSYSEEIGESD